jgi:hypothetical protein
MCAAQSISQLTSHKDHVETADKPPYSYVALISMALDSFTDGKATQREIVSYIQARFPYYRQNTMKLTTAIRHNLTLNDCFMKSGRRLGDKGCLWTRDPAYEDMFKHGSLLRRKFRLKEGRVDKYNRCGKSQKAKKIKMAAMSAVADSDVKRLLNDINKKNSSENTENIQMRNRQDLNQMTRTPRLSTKPARNHYEQMGQQSLCDSGLVSDVSFSPCTYPVKECNKALQEISFTLQDVTTNASIDLESLDVTPIEEISIPFIMDTYRSDVIQFSEVMIFNNSDILDLASAICGINPASESIPDLTGSLTADVYSFDTTFGLNF